MKLSQPAMLAIVATLIASEGCYRLQPVAPASLARGAEATLAFASPRSVRVLGCGGGRQTPLLDHVGGVIERIAADTVTLSVKSIAQDPTPPCTPASVEVILERGVALEESQPDPLRSAGAAAVGIALLPVILYFAAFGIPFAR